MIERRYDIELGWAVLETPSLSREEIRQLIQLSQDTSDKEVQNFTSDRERFKEQKSIEQWGETRTIFLLKKDASVKGIIWFKKEVLEGTDKDITFAIRLYKDARGQGFSLPFMKECFTRFKEEGNLPDPEKVWLRVSVGNQPAIHLYEKFGFEKFVIEEDKMIMTLNKKQINEH